MTENLHPLTETRAAELWEVHIPERKTEYLGWQSFPEPSRRCFTTILRAAFDAGREHEREHADPHHDPRPWQDCTREDIRKGDLVEQRNGDLLRIGVAHHRDEWGDWWTEDDYILTDDAHWPLRRIPAPTPPAEEVELPTEFGAVITDVRYGVEGRVDRLVNAGQAGWVEEAGHFWYPTDISACTLPDGTRARRDGEREDGTPRFVKVQEGEE